MESVKDKIDTWQTLIAKIMRDLSDPLTLTTAESVQLIQLYDCLGALAAFFHQVNRAMPRGK